MRVSQPSKSTEQSNDRGREKPSDTSSNASQTDIIHVMVMYNFTHPKSCCLNATAGEILTVSLQKSYREWYSATNAKGMTGIIPRTYCRML